MPVSKEDMAMLKRLKALLAEDDSPEVEEIDTKYGKALVFDCDESFYKRIEKWFGPGETEEGTEDSSDTPEDEEPETEEVETPKKEPARRSSNRFFGG